jgi:hypothetical protein
MKAVTKLKRRQGRIFTFIVINKNKQIEISCLCCGWTLIDQRASVLSLDLTIMWSWMVSKSGDTASNARHALSTYGSNCIQQRTSAVSLHPEHLFKPVLSATSTISNQPPSLLWSALLIQQTAVDSPTGMPYHTAVDCITVCWDGSTCMFGAQAALMA